MKKSHFKKLILFILIITGLIVSITASPALLLTSEQERFSAPEAHSNAKPASDSGTFWDANRENRKFLKPGPEIKTDKMAGITSEKKRSAVPGNTTTEHPETEGKVAELSVMGGGMLKQTQSGKALGTLSTNLITSQLNSLAHDKLDNYGTFEINLSADERLSLRNSSFDMLLPLYDTQEHVIFTQAGLRRFDERTQSNMGLGFRTFRSDWFFGSNVFLDRDFSQKHLRGSIGLEAGTDYLRGGINRYQRLSGWRDTDEYMDMASRPASGWDLITQGWLPAYPQLGAMIKYEKYQGQNVALHSRSRLERNPAALTTGLSWTPLPMATFNAHRTHVKHGKHDNVVGLELRYQYGMPLNAQLTPQNVNNLRKMQGSRHDLVERNNNIVLDYRKKQVISLSVDSMMTGTSGETKPLIIGIKSKYSIDKFIWDAVSFQENGGQITDNGRGNFNLLMPIWKSGGPEKNAYNLTVSAADIRGNVSAGSRIRVTVKPAPISKALSFIDPAMNQSPADGKSVITFSLTLLDERKNPVELPEREVLSGVKIHKEGTDGISESDSGVHIESSERAGPGIYTIRVIAGNTPGKYLLSATYGEAELKPARLILTAVNTVDSVVSVKLADSYTEKPADGKSVFNYVLKVTDSKNHPRKGVRLFTRVDKQDVTISENVMTDENGQAEVQLKSGLKAVRDISVYAGTDEHKMTAADRKVSFIADKQSAFISKLIITSDNAPADGSSKDLLNAYVEDKAGNHVSGASVKFSAEKGILINGRESEAHVLTDKSGQAKAEITSIRPGSFRVSAEAEYSTAHIVKDAKVSFSDVKYPYYNASINSDLTEIPADGVSSAHVRIEVSDPEGKPVAGLKDRLSLKLTSQGSVPASDGLVITKITELSPGVYTSSISSSLAMKVDVIAEVKDIDLHVKPLLLKFKPLTAVAENSTVSLDKASYLLGSNVRIVIHLRDNSNTPVSNAQKEIRESVYLMGALNGDWIENGKGVYQADYNTNATGKAQVVRLKMRGWNKEIQSRQYTVYGKPQVEDIRITGSAFVGHTLSAQLIGFNSNYTGEEDSEYFWEYQSGSNWFKSEFKKSFTPSELYDGDNVRVCVNPKGREQSIKGDQKCSKPVRILSTAAISSVDISGLGVAGNTLAGSAVVKKSKGQNVSVKYQWYYRSGNGWMKISGPGSTSTSWKVTRDYPGYEVKFVATPYGSLSGEGTSVSSKSVLINSRTDKNNPDWIKPRMNLGCWWGKGDRVSWDIPRNAPSDLSVTIYKEHNDYTRVLIDTVPATKLSSDIYGTGSDYYYIIIMKDKYGNSSAESSGRIVSRPIIGNCETKVYHKPSSSGEWIK